MSADVLREGELETQVGAVSNSDDLRASTDTPMLGRLMQLELPLAVALGRATVPIHELLKMTSGSLIELDRSSGEYVDLIIHGTVVARGEIVSVRGSYGVRIKELISRKDRLSLSDAG